MHNQRVQHKQQAQDSEASFSSSAASFDSSKIRSTVHWNHAEDRSHQLRDDTNSSAYVDSFFLPGGIFEPDDAKTEPIPDATILDVERKQEKESISVSMEDPFSKTKYKFPQNFDVVNAGLAMPRVPTSATDSNVMVSHGLFHQRCDADDVGSSGFNLFSMTNSTPVIHQKNHMISLDRDNTGIGGLPLQFDSQSSALVHQSVDGFHRSPEINQDPRMHELLASSDWNSKSSQMLSNYATHDALYRNPSVLSQPSSTRKMDAAGPSSKSWRQSTALNGHSPPQSILSSDAPLHAINWTESKVVGPSLLRSQESTAIPPRSTLCSTTSTFGDLSDPWNCSSAHLKCSGTNQNIQLQTYNYLSHSPIENSSMKNDFRCDRFHTVLSSSRTLPHQIPPVGNQDPRNFGSTVIQAPLLSQAFLGNSSGAHASNQSVAPAGVLRPPPGFASAQSYHHTRITPLSGPVPLARNDLHGTHTLGMVNHIDAIETRIEDVGTDIVTELVDLQQRQSHQQPQPKKQQQIASGQDRDIDSLSSRGVPSTIYLRTDDDEDGISYSEDTLTACADSVVEYEREYQRKSLVNDKGRLESFNGSNNLNENTYRLSTKDGLLQSVECDYGGDHQHVVTEMKEETTIIKPDESEEHKEIHSTVDERSKRHKRKKKRAKKLSSESVCSLDASHEVLINGKELDVESNTNQNPSLIKVSLDVTCKSDSVQRDTLSSPASIHENNVINADKNSIREPGYQNKYPRGRNSTNPHINRHTKSLKTGDQANTSLKPTIPKKSMLCMVRQLLRKSRPIIFAAWVMLGSFLTTCSKEMYRGITSLFPSWERLWFVLPLLCFFSDLLFLMSCVISSCVGKILYVILLTYKLAFVEIFENKKLIVCYTTCCYFPTLASIVTKLFPQLPSGTVLVTWYTILRVILLPVDMKDTFLYRVQWDDKYKSLEALFMKVAHSREGSMRHRIEVERLTRDKKEIFLEESDRIHLTNQFLSILRYTIPIFLVVECLSTNRHGFIVSTTLPERILLGFGLTVTCMGYIFIPIIFFSWTIQMFVYLFFPMNLWTIHLLYVIGLSSIRLTHYTASVDDAKSSFKKASISFHRQ